jgi:3'-phosphoadenosine 5'-phosphosulfate sulfotransferase (PAPS reductase)/FAD synthetase
MEYEALNRHEKIGLQLSGGKDSIACVYLLRPYLDRITVYWVNTGAAYPETIDVIDALREFIPNFVEISGNQPSVIEQFGIPSDVVPASRTPMGLFGSGSNERMIQDRYSCCMRTIMFPLHQRMIDDGITLVIRGQKTADRLKSTARSGDVIDGIEFLFPVEDWTSDRVMAYLRSVNAPISRVYDVLAGTPDCINCSGWWEERAAKYLKSHHPIAYAEVQRRLDDINAAVSEHITAFNREVAE